MSHPIIQGIFKFLESGVFCTDNGWLFSIPSNNDYAHAPWWAYDPKANEIESIGVTAKILSFIISYADHGSELYKKAMTLSERMIEKLQTQTHFGDMGIGGYCVFTDTLKQTGLVNQHDYDLLIKILKKLVFESIERDSSKWIYYGVRPSNYIHSPSSVFYKENEEIVQKELEYLIDTRPKNDV